MIKYLEPINLFSNSGAAPDKLLVEYQYLSCLLILPQTVFAKVRAYVLTKDHNGMVTIVDSTNLEQPIDVDYDDEKGLVCPAVKTIKINPIPNTAYCIHVEIDNAELIQLNNVGFTYRKKALDIGDHSTNEEVYPYSC